MNGLRQAGLDARDSDAALTFLICAKDFVKCLVLLLDIISQFELTIAQQLGRFFVLLHLCCLESTFVLVRRHGKYRPWLQIESRARLLHYVCLLLRRLLRARPRLQLAEAGVDNIVAASLLMRQLLRLLESDALSQVDLIASQSRLGQTGL